jgi:hypothetical protein
MTMSVAPKPGEAAEYYFTYIDKVPPGDICRTLETQAAETVALLRSISDERSLHRYASGKWSIREAIGHVNDTERLFVFRALWFARGFDTPLPSFDQGVAVATARADERSWTGLIEEFAAVRAATVTFFQGLSADDWSRQGVASGNPFTVRALAYITAGHVAHHNAILREQYLKG